MSSNLQILFSLFQDEINVEAKLKSTLNELEQEFNNCISLIRSHYANLSSIQPANLSKDSKLYSKSTTMKFTFKEELAQASQGSRESGDTIDNLGLLSNIYEVFSEKLTKIDCKPIFKEKLAHKINEDIFFLLLVNRYFKVIARCFEEEQKDNQKISIPLVSKDNDSILGMIITPQEISQMLSLEKINYSDYLLSMLKLIETIVDYTTETIILLSIENGNNLGAKKQYSLSLINFQIISKLQNGFQLLDLKNDNIRRKFDGLKYNLKKVNSIVYDLSLRSLISNEVTIT